MNTKYNHAPHAPHAPHAIDQLGELEARIAFLQSAALAFTLAQDGMLPDTKAWMGLYYITNDLLEMTAQTAKLTPLT